MSQRFKTVYFPDRSGTADDRNSLTLAFGTRDATLFGRVRDLSSLELRELLALPDWSTLVENAEAAGLGYSTYCLSQLRTHQHQADDPGQLGLWSDPSTDGMDPLLATYRGGNGELFHDWFPYLEGYAPEFVERVINEFAPDAKVVLDPFGGSGTTPLVAAMRGLQSFYCEVNPVLQYLTAAKLDALALDARTRPAVAMRLRVIARDLEHLIREVAPADDLTSTYGAVFGDSKFFEPATLDVVLRVRSHIDLLQVEEPLVARFLTVAAMGALLPSSNLIRRGDVRYRVGKEVEAVVPYAEATTSILEIIAGDIASVAPASVRPELLLEDARNLLRLPSVEADVVVTSPPYLNGTNYFRNTKLELWFLRSLMTPDDLAAFRRRAVTAGINDVSRGKGIGTVLESAGRVVKSLEENAYDRRIPRMVQAYFEDMAEILEGLVHQVRVGGAIVIDIGDSNYGGVNVPTDAILTELMVGLGTSLERRVVLRRRQAKSGPAIHQVLLVFRREAQKRRQQVAPRAPWSSNWNQFKAELPHQRGDFAKRNWGHPLHSLCSYGGKMKPSLASHLIQVFVPAGGVVLDPFAGVGTIPFEAALNGRRSFSFEISPAAFHVARGKLRRQDASEVEVVLDALDQFIAGNDPAPTDYASAEAIHFNGRIADYFQEATYREILLARRFFLEQRDLSTAGSFVLAALLHVLHGNRPYALSRTSHPITPFAPSGAFEYRAVGKQLRAKVHRSLAAGLPDSFVDGEVIYQDATTWWPDRVQQLDAVVTSPPFFDSTRFHVQNWMRLWFCGWEARDFSVKPQAFVDERQKRGFEVYGPVLRQARERLRPGGVVAMHLGKSHKKDMAVAMAAYAKPWFKVLDMFEEDVTHLESHGLRDKGTVVGHTYLILG